MTDTTKLRELLAAATPGPLRIEAEGEWASILPADSRLSLMGYYLKTPVVRRADAELFVAAVNALPELLDALEASELLLAQISDHEDCPDSIGEMSADAECGSRS